MSEAVMQLRDQLSLLPREQRAELAHFLIDTLDDEIDANYDPAWEAELLRREAEIRSGTVQGVPARQAIEAIPE